MSKNLIFAIHGFLGQSSDWNKTKEELVSLTSPSEHHWITPDLFSLAALPIEDFEDFVCKLIEFYRSEISPHSKKIFLGYSLGGRLGLYIMKMYPQLFDHFFFISTNSGLRATDEKLARLQHDKSWQQKLSSLPWNDFLTAWNSQAIFAGESPVLARKKSDFDVEKLKLSLIKWSLGRQDDLSLVMQQNQSKISWVVGSKDIKFVKLAENLKQKKILLDYNRIFSGHRILNDNPKSIAQLAHYIA